MLVILVSACGQNEQDEAPQTNQDISQVTEPAFYAQTDETKEMVNTLRELSLNGIPENNIYWNQKRSDKLSEIVHNGQEMNFSPTWYEYCQELLWAGNPQACITELETYFDMSRPLYDQLNRPDDILIIELMALAHLRLGEQENCQNAHTAFSCILPLQQPGVHQLTKGSEKAIELYEIVFSKFPKDSHKWLLNLAYMTLGKHPQEVPKSYLLNFPNWEKEQQNFPRFNEIAMNVNVGENTLSGGTCVEDFNQDGYLDIFITAFGTDEQCHLFINDQKGSFVDKTNEAGLRGLTGGLNCVHADYNNDGFQDILILRGAWLEQGGNHPNSLLRNNGNDTFDDVTKSAGIYSLHPTQVATWADFNRDGFLDLFIGNETTGNAYNKSELYQNNGDGTFTEVSESSGVGALAAFVKGASWGDINNDNWPDLFVSVMGGKNKLFINNEGIFEDISAKAKIEEPLESFPCWFWDVNNDGLQDIYVGGYETTYPYCVSDCYAKELQGIPTPVSKPRLYINNGNETFTDKTKAYNLDKSIFPMGANYGDLDNDGYLDFYLGTGCPDFDAVVPNRMFRNVDGKTFEEVTSAGGFGHIQKGHGIAFADIDQDGDQDIYAVMGGAYQGDDFTNVLFENPGFGNNWITIDLQGITSARSAIGTRMELQLDNGKKIYCTAGTGGSFGSSSLQQEIGLGQAKKIKKLTIYWQHGETQTFEMIDINQKIKITENKPNLEIVQYNPVPFKAGSAEPHHHH